MPMRLLRAAAAALTVSLFTLAPAEATPVQELPAPSAGCNYDGCLFGSPSGIIHDGYRFQASSVPGAWGSVGWWDHFSAQPAGTYFIAQLCNGTMPYDDSECGPSTAVHRVPARPASVRDIIAEFFPEQVQRASDIAWCESTHNPRAVSPGGGNHGLFQINNVHRASFERVTGEPWSAVYDARHNAEFARWLYLQQGWGPWSCA